MAIIHDTNPDASSDLAKLWATWDVPSVDGKEQEVSERLGSVALDDHSHNPSIQRLKLDVFKDVILYYNQNDQKSYLKIIKDLQSPQVEKFNIESRLVRAKEGKEAANKKYKDGYKLEAMFTYAVAWGLLLPYYLEHFPKSEGNPEEDVRNEVGKLECALFSNISAMAVMLAKEDDLTPEKTESLGQIGLGSSEICISAKEFVSVGIMVKSCRRAKEIAQAIPTSSVRSVPADKIRFFEEQEEKLKDVKDDKQLFEKIASTHSAIPAKVEV